MEREIANVAAACAMRGFRYMAFPPIVFDAPQIEVSPPVPLAAWQAPEAEPPPRPAAWRFDEMPPPPRTTMADEHVAAAPDNASARAPALDQPVPAGPPAEPARAAARPSPSQSAAREPRFALLAEVAAQLHRPAPP